MADPCKQESHIGALEATLEAVAETLRDIKHNQDRFIGILENIAAQATKIAKLESDTETLYARVRKVELNAVEHGVKITAAAGMFSIFITAIASFLLKHWGK